MEGVKLNNNNKIILYSISVVTKFHKQGSKKNKHNTSYNQVDWLEPSIANQYAKSFALRKICL